jgi:hypothetical protein
MGGVVGAAFENHAREEVEVSVGFCWSLGWVLS